MCTSTDLRKPKSIQIRCVCQVLAYLAAEDQAMYDSPDAWDAMQLRVVEGLEQLHESD